MPSQPYALKASGTGDGVGSIRSVNGYYAFLLCRWTAWLGTAAALTGAPGMARAQSAPPNSTSTVRLNCKAYTKLELTASFQVFRLPALHEGTDGFRLSSPGTITEALAASIDEVAERTLCLVRERSLPPYGVRLSVRAGTDDRPARRLWTFPLKRAGVSDADAQHFADAVMNMTASQIRGAVIADRLRQRISELLSQQPESFGLDSSAPAQAALEKAIAAEIVPRVTAHETNVPPATTSLYTPQPTPQPRDFAVVLSVVTTTVAIPAPRPSTSSNGNERRHDAGAQQPPPPPPDSRPEPGGSAALSVGVDAAYLRAFAHDHLGWSFSTAWRSNWRLESATTNTRGGLRFGGRIAIFLSDKSYRLSSQLNAPVLPFAEAAVGPWLRFGLFEGRLSLLGGGVLPAMGGTIQAAASLTVLLPASFDVTLGGSGGVLLSRSRATSAQAIGIISIGIGRSY